jgi:putative ABC transport system ATP-binding protein
MIEVQNLFKSYENKTVQALNDLSLMIKKGEIVALTGPSGCGKSTLLNIIGGLDRPDSGSVRIKDQELIEYKSLPAYRSQIVGFVFQFHHLIPSLTLVENVELPMYSQSVPFEQRRQKASDLLVETGLKDRLHFLPPKVSGGERQRAAIARSMVNDPEIILADEPTGSIDSQTGQKVMGILINRCLHQGATLIIATHNPLIADMTQRVISLRDGRMA